MRVSLDLVSKTATSNSEGRNLPESGGEVSDASDEGSVGAGRAVAGFSRQPFIGG